MTDGASGTCCSNGRAHGVHAWTAYGFHSASRHICIQWTQGVHLPQIPCNSNPYLPAQQHLRIHAGQAARQVVNPELYKIAVSRHWDGKAHGLGVVS